MIFDEKQLFGGCIPQPHTQVSGSGEAFAAAEAIHHQQIAEMVQPAVTVEQALPVAGLAVNNVVAEKPFTITRF